MSEGGCDGGIIQGLIDLEKYNVNGSHYEHLFGFTEVLDL